MINELPNTNNHSLMCSSDKAYVGSSSVTHLENIMGF